MVQLMSVAQAKVSIHLFTQLWWSFSRTACIKTPITVMGRTMMTSPHPSLLCSLQVVLSHCQSVNTANKSKGAKRKYFLPAASTPKAMMINPYTGLSQGRANGSKAAPIPPVMCKYECGFVIGYLTPRRASIVPCSSKILAAALICASRVKPRSKVPFKPKCF